MSTTKVSDRFSHWALGLLLIWWYEPRRVLTLQFKIEWIIERWRKMEMCQWNININMKYDWRKKANALRMTSIKPHSISPFQFHLIRCQSEWLCLIWLNRFIHLFVLCLTDVMPHLWCCRLENTVCFSESCRKPKHVNVTLTWWNICFSLHVDRMMWLLPLHSVNSATKQLFFGSISAPRTALV